MRTNLKLESPFCNLDGAITPTTISSRGHERPSTVTVELHNIIDDVANRESQRRKMRNQVLRYHQVGTCTTTMPRAQVSQTCVFGLSGPKYDQFTLDEGRGYF